MYLFSWPSIIRRRPESFLLLFVFHLWVSLASSTDAGLQRYLDLPAAPCFDRPDVPQAGGRTRTFTRPISAVNVPVGPVVVEPETSATIADSHMEGPVVTTDDFQAEVITSQPEAAVDVGVQGTVQPAATEDASLTEIVRDNVAGRSEAMALMQQSGPETPPVVPVMDSQAQESAGQPEETTTTETTTTTASTTTGAPSSLGFGGSLSNVISGGAGGDSGGGFLALLTTTKGPDVPKGNFDRYLDTILMNLGKALRQNGFDPVAVGKMLQCRNCTLEGLSLIRRNGPSNLKYVNRTLTVDAFLQIPALYISCFPCVEVIMMVPFTAMFELALWDLQIYGKVTQRAERGAHPSLVEYKVLREGDLDITLHGYGILGPVTEMGFKLLYQRMVSEVIREFIYDRVPNFIEEKLQGFNFPIGK